MSLSCNFEFGLTMNCSNSSGSAVCKSLDTPFVVNFMLLKLSMQVFYLGRLCRSIITVCDQVIKVYFVFPHSTCGTDGAYCRR